MSHFFVSYFVVRIPSNQPTWAKALVLDPADASLKPKPLLNNQAQRHVESRLPVDNVSCTSKPSFLTTKKNKKTLAWKKMTDTKENPRWFVISNPRSDVISLELEALPEAREQVVSSCASLCDSFQEVWHSQSHSQMKPHSQIKKPFIIKKIRYQTWIYVSCMKGICKGKPTPKQPYKVQYLHFRYLKLLVIITFTGMTFTVEEVFQFKMFPSNKLMKTKYVLSMTPCQPGEWLYWFWRVPASLIYLWFFDYRLYHTSSENAIHF